MYKHIYAIKIEENRGREFKGGSGEVYERIERKGEMLILNYSLKKTKQCKRESKRPYRKLSCNMHNSGPRVINFQDLNIFNVLDKD